ncbi:unnamed protein product [Rotaria sordida]|uniref:Uncharacterized protein n=1 Tax=Rotaria sordida TaxID=392033 RepID=A0A820B5J8_9BILA|nr:unnamed protein product [Rotaria sordida]
MTQKNVDEYQRAQCIALRKTGMSYHAIGINAELYDLEDNFIVQHDNARLHTSKQTQAKLHELHAKALK